MTAHAAGLPNRKTKKTPVASESASVPFGERLRDLLIAQGITTGMGNPNWSAFAERMDGVHYETLRKAVTGERAPAPALMERCAAALNVSPDVFDEYALYRAQQMFDPRQTDGGLDEAMANLRLFVEARSKKR